jgi:hypothetical protein
LHAQRQSRQVRYRRLLGLQNLLPGHEAVSRLSLQGDELIDDILDLDARNQAHARLNAGHETECGAVELI